MSMPKVIRNNLQHPSASIQKIEIVASNKCGIYVEDMMFSSFEASDQGHSDLKQYATFH